MKRKSAQEKSYYEGQIAGEQQQHHDEFNSRI